MVAGGAGAPMKILVIEDDRESAAYLVKGLGESGYVGDLRLL
jgi:DNA-binding response OmpR family regulator